MLGSFILSPYKLEDTNLLFWHQSKAHINVDVVNVVDMAKSIKKSFSHQTPEAKDSELYSSYN